MKTKISTFIGMVALGLISFTNINASAANHELNAFAVVETEENLSIESWMLDSNLWIENSASNVDNAETEKALEIESWMTEEDFFKSAESFTAEGADEEVEKYATKQINLEHERESK